MACLLTGPHVLRAGCYSALSSLHPLTEELELELLAMISQNAMEQHSPIVRKISCPVSSKINTYTVV